MILNKSKTHPEQIKIINASSFIKKAPSNPYLDIKAVMKKNKDVQLDIARMEARKSQGNLTAEQTTEQINFAANVQEMFTDQAAENATEQFNATGQIQVEEFFQELGAKVRTRNAELAVANDQFNVDQKNSINQFNNQIKNDRDKFEANLSTQIQQSNAVWRRNINTVNNSAQNEANKINSQNILGINEVAQANLWQAYRDDAQFLIQTTENALQRAHQVGILSQQQDFQAEQYREAADDAMWGQIGALAGTIITSLVTS